MMSGDKDEHGRDDLTGNYKLGNTVRGRLQEQQ
jgi:hypothetical protein